MYFLEKAFKRLEHLYRHLYLSDGCEPLKSYVLGGALGGALHISLDAPLYQEMGPLAPFYTSSNPLYIADISIFGAIVLVYDIALFLGFALYTAYFFYYSCRDHGTTVSIFRLGVLLILISILLSLFVVPMSVVFGEGLGVLVFSATLFVLAFSGLLLSTLSLAKLKLLSTQRLSAVIAVAVVLALVPLWGVPEPLTISVIYVGVAVILILIRKPLSVLKIQLLGTQMKIVDILIASWIAVVVLIGIPMLIATLTLLTAKSHQLKSYTGAHQAEQKFSRLSNVQR